MDEIRTIWNAQHRNSATMCAHRLRGQNCNQGAACTMGLRMSTRYVLYGAYLDVYEKVQELIADEADFQ